MAKRKLFASFTSTLREMHEGRATADDLAIGYFVFGCDREHALAPWNDDPNEIQWFWKDFELGRAAHAVLAAHLLVAEKENRVFWRTKHTEGIRIHLISAMAEIDMEVIR